MRTGQTRIRSPKHRRAEAELDGRIQALFGRVPMLSGFSVIERSQLTRDRNAGVLEGDLCLADVSISTWPGYHASEDLYEEIAQALLRLLQERGAEAYEMLRGRTFARVSH